jgi:hypothetical protein
VTRELRLFNKNIGRRKTERLCMAAESCPVPVSENSFQRGEGPVNGGGNYDPLKVSIIALMKFGYMLEYLSIPHYCFAVKMCRVQAISRKDRSKY